MLHKHNLYRVSRIVCCVRAPRGKKNKRQNLVTNNKEIVFYTTDNAVAIEWSDVSNTAHTHTHSVPTMGEAVAATSQKM